MDNHKDAAALDGHPKQQRETEPSSKRPDSRSIIICDSKTEQLPRHPNLIAALKMQDTTVQICGGYL